MVVFSNTTQDDEIRDTSASAFGWSDICGENVDRENYSLAAIFGQTNFCTSLQFSAPADSQLFPITRTSDKLASLTINRWIRLMGLKPWTVCHLQRSRSGFWKRRHFHIRLKNPLCWCSLCWAWPFHFPNKSAALPQPRTGSCLTVTGSRLFYQLRGESRQLKCINLHTSVLIKYLND